MTTKIYSWNVNGIRAVIKKELLMPFLENENPDILCLQETKAKKEQVDLSLPNGYEQFWYSAEKPGYSGTAIFTKIKPLKVVNGFPEDIIKKYQLSGDVYGDPNKEGRIMAAEFDKFWLVTVYTPNAKDDLSRLNLRHKHWDPAFLAYCQGLETGAFGVDGVQGAAEQQTAAVQNSTTKGAAQSATQQSAASKRSGKPVIFCGDLNVAFAEDDLANPKPNRGKKGFTDEERTGFQNFVNNNFIDTLRIFKQGNGYYTWWSHFANARARNVGWRIDYFLVSEKLKSKVKSAKIHPKILGSDHCPVSIEFETK
ncbi:MAG: exodeoxyribonuclease III [Candidatus Saccharimonadales bacterium]